jgi:hypothetical protein
VGGVTAWVIVGVVLGVAALAILGYLGLRVFLQVKALMKQVGQAGERINTAAAPLTRALAARGGDGSGGR